MRPLKFAMDAGFAARWPLALVSCSQSAALTSIVRLWGRLCSLRAHSPRHGGRSNSPRIHRNHRALFRPLGAGTIDFHRRRSFRAPLTNKKTFPNFPHRVKPGSLLNKKLYFYPFTSQAYTSVIPSRSARNLLTLSQPCLHRRCIAQAPLPYPRPRFFTTATPPF